MANFPRWFYRPTLPVPSCYESWAEEVGEAIREDRVRRDEVAARLGIGNGQVRTLFAYCKGKSAHGPVRDKRPPNMANTPYSDPVREPPPPTDRWDKNRRASSVDMSTLRDEGPAEDEVSIEELLERKRDRWRRHDKRYGANEKEQVLNVPAGICGLFIMGDPHLDDNGCNWDKVESHIQTVAATPHCYGIQIGDVTNNWVGSLQRLHGHQSTTIEEGDMLFRWLIESLPWLGWVLGNHDEWNQGARLIREMMRGNTTVAAMGRAELKLRLKWPDGQTMGCHFRHAFRGGSQYSKSFAPAKRAQFHPWADLYAMGHIHSWGLTKQEGFDNVPRDALVVRGYKEHDSYAKSGDFQVQKHGHSCIVILNPKAPPASRVTVCWDIEEGCEVLTWQRNR